MAVLSYDLTSVSAEELGVDVGVKTESTIKVGEKESEESEESSESKVEASSETKVGVSVESETKESSSESEQTESETTAESTTSAESKSQITIRTAYPEVKADSESSFVVQSKNNLYAPGEKISVKGSLWSSLMAQLGASDTVTITVLDSNGNVVHQKDVTVQSNGSFNAEVMLPPSSAEGQYTITSKVTADSSMLGSLDATTKAKLETKTKIIIAKPVSVKVSTQSNNDVEVKVASNSKVSDVKFVAKDKKVSFKVEGESGTKGVAKVTIPKILLSGQIKVMIDGKVMASDDVIVTTNTKAETALELNYNHSVHTIDVIGTSTEQAQPGTVNETESMSAMESEMTEKSEMESVPAEESNTAMESETTSNEGGGCLIATAAFGTELAPQVQFLREVRDNTIMSTASGTAFMTEFNQLYYSFSPTIADIQRENPVFQQAVKLFITPMISTLSIMTLADQGSEFDVLTAGISVIALNLAMYIAAPAMVAVKVSQHIKSRK